MNKYKLPEGWAFIDIEDMTQGKLEKWQRAFNSDFTAGSAVYNGAVVRASIKAGWFSECPMSVADVVKQPLKNNPIPAIAKSIDLFYSDVLEMATPDPN